MKNKKRIVIVTPDGTGIKNYLYSNVFKGAPASLHLFHNFDGDTLSHIQDQIEVELDVVIPGYTESVREKYLRELIHASRIRYNAKTQKNPTILAFRKRKHASLKLKVFHAFVSFSLNSISSYQKILKLEAKYERALRKNPFYEKVKEMLRELKPDALFCTHQRALKAPAIFAAARDLGIPTTTVIYSWDNLPKARLALKADTYLAWSEHMKNELATFYPEISKEKIKVTGTPQFEFFQDESNILPKEDFFSKHNLDTEKKLICFSGDDVKTSPYDPHYLNDLAAELTRSGMAETHQIIFRRCPVDLSGRYDWVLEKYPELIRDIPPLWHYNSKVWTAVYPVYDDIKLLVSLAKYCDMVINVGSTMAFDFGMFQKPCIYINYDHRPDKNWSVKTIYNYQHFRSMPSKKAVYWLNSKEEIPQTIQAATLNKHTEIREWFRVVVNHEQSASQNIIKELL